MHYLGFGRESAPAGTTAGPIFFPFLREGEEHCIWCGETRPIGAMEQVASDAEDGQAIYACVTHLLADTPLDVHAFSEQWRKALYG